MRSIKPRFIKKKPKFLFYKKIPIATGDACFQPMNTPLLTINKCLCCSYLLKKNNSILLIINIVNNCLITSERKVYSPIFSLINLLSMVEETQSTLINHLIKQLRFLRTSFRRKTGWKEAFRLNERRKIECIATTLT